MYNMQLIKWRPKKEREKERKEEGKGPERRGGRKRKETNKIKRKLICTFSEGF